MRLLLFSDLHRDRTAAQRLVKLSRDADVVVGAGDFATMRQGLAETLAILADITKPAVLVPGNAESFEELQDGCAHWPTARVLHGTLTDILGTSFHGLGGAVPPTPFGPWSDDFTEAAAAQWLQGCPQGGVLVTHSPPKGCLDVSSRGVSLGSTAIRDAVLRCRPKLLVCGHIHDSSGQQACLGETVVINAGPAGMWFVL